MPRLMSASNAGGVWFGDASPSVDLTGWLTFLAFVAAIGGLCWLGNWAVKRSYSGEEARSTNRGTVQRLVDGIIQTYRS